MTVRPAVLMAFSLAAAMGLAGLGAASQVVPASHSAVSTASVPTDVRRNVVWYGVPQAAPRTIHIESTSVNAPSPDEYQITYSAGNFTVVYQRAAGGPITTQYTLSIEGLVEWNDTSGDGQYEPGNDVAYTPLGGNAFGGAPITHSHENVSNGVGVDTFGIASKQGGVTLNLTIADGFVQLPSGQSLTPMEAKLTLEINHTMTSPGTRLSLQISMTTYQKVMLQNQSWDDQNEFSSDDHALNVTNDVQGASSSAFFAWSNTASVNGEPGQVIPTLSANETTGNYDLYLTYPAVTNTLQLQITHDPTLGVVSAAYLSTVHPGPASPTQFAGDAVVYAVSLVAIALLVVGSVLLVSRRRRQGP